MRRLSITVRMVTAPMGSVGMGTGGILITTRIEATGTPTPRTGTGRVITTGIEAIGILTARTGIGLIITTGIEAIGIDRITATTARERAERSVAGSLAAREDCCHQKS